MRCQTTNSSSLPYTKLPFPLATHQLLLRREGVHRMEQPKRTYQKQSAVPRVVIYHDGSGGAAWSLVNLFPASRSQTLVDIKHRLQQPRIRCPLTFSMSRAESAQSAIHSAVASFVEQMLD